MVEEEFSFYTTPRQKVVKDNEEPAERESKE